jgi:hypothetical protein
MNYLKSVRRIFRRAAMGGKQTLCLHDVTLPQP